MYILHQFHTSNLPIVGMWYLTFNFPGLKQARTEYVCLNGVRGCNEKQHPFGLQKWDGPSAVTPAHGSLGVPDVLSPVKLTGGTPRCWQNIVIVS